LSSSSKLLKEEEGKIERLYFKVKREYSTKYLMQDIINIK